MREPSDLIPYYEYWELAQKDRAQAEHWYLAHCQSLSFWDDVPMMFPGFYRYQYKGNSSKMQHVKGQYIPVAIWIEQQKNDEGELIADEVVLVKSGVFPAFHADTDSNYLGEIGLLMAWEQCRKSPVTKEMYDYAIGTYMRESAYRWFDDKAPVAKPAPIEIKDARSLF